MIQRDNYRYPLIYVSASTMQRIQEKELEDDHPFYLYFRLDKENSNNFPVLNKKYGHQLRSPSAALLLAVV